MSDAQFRLELDREWLAKQEEIADLVATVGLQALNSLVQRSPVRFGQFKGNWVTTIVQPDPVTTRPGANESASLAQGVPVLESYPQELPQIYIQNNLPYAVPLENGHSKQAPAGMVAVTVASLAAAFDKDI